MFAHVDDTQELASNAREIDQTQWPWPLISYFVGTSSPDAVRKAATSAEDESERKGRVCEADFFLGEEQLVKGAERSARVLFQAAVEHCPKNYLEYVAAQNELKRADIRGQAKQ